MGELDTPLTPQDLYKERLQKASLYSIAFLEAMKRNEEMRHLMYEWYNIYEQPMSTLLFICLMIGIVTPPTKHREEVIQAMKNHKFLPHQQAFLSFLEYTAMIEQE